jgi:hypothetical protein
MKNEQSSVRWERVISGMAIALLIPGVMAEVTIGGNGMPSVSLLLNLPPGVAGMTPRVSLTYTAGPNGPVGLGWSLSGIPSITRCAPTRAIDADDGTLKFDENDKLCLNGQRLIQAYPDGQSRPFPQTGDAAGVYGNWMTKEFRLQADPSIRIRGYSQLGTDPAWGPKYFKVQYSSGVIQTFGNAGSASLTGGFVRLSATKGPAWVWLLQSEEDSAGNTIDYSYRRVTKGPAFAGDIDGQDWAIYTINYGGNTRLGTPTTTGLLFDYEERPDGPDQSSWYAVGTKRTTVFLLRRIDVQGPAVSGQPSVVRSYHLKYTKSPVTGISQLSEFKECTDSSEVKCLPPTSFTPSQGSSAVAVRTLPEGLAQRQIGRNPSTGKRESGVLSGDFNGDGKTDLVVWTANGGSSLYFGGPTLTAAASYNIASKVLFSGGTDAESCSFTMAADFDGDGLTDLLRYTSPDGMSLEGEFNACPQGTSTLYRSQGNGNFAEVSVPRIKRSRGRAGAGGKLDYFSNFVVGDFNRDGRLDIVTIDGGQQGYLSVNTPGIECSFCGGVGVWLGGTGGFSSAVTGQKFGGSSNIVPYVLPGDHFARDANSDGVPDLAFPSYTVTYDGRYFESSAGYFAGSRSGTFNGSLAFSSSIPVCTGAIRYGDFNGDGISDMLCAKPTNTFGSDVYISLARGEAFSPWNRIASNFKISSLSDVNDDGRTDILGEYSYSSTPERSQLISLGNGNFQRTAAEGIAFELAQASPQTQLITGNFTGSGSLEVLSLTRTSSSFGSNKLFVKQDPMPPGLLAAAKTPTGAVTTIQYQNITSSDRYATARGTTHAAIYPNVDLTLPMMVATSLTTDTGVGTSRSTTELGYFGFQGNHLGRGSQGFREIRLQSDAPDGVSKLTKVNQYLQTHPYTGMVALSETYLAPLSAMNAPQTGLKLSRTENVYCDTRSPAGAETSATVTSPCTATGKLQFPYLRKSVVSAWDLNGVALPVNTTTTTFTGNYPTLVESTTTGSGPAGAQTFVKTTVNEYWPDNFGGDIWLLGLLKRSTVTSTVPDSLNAISTSAGSAPKATATAGP